MADDFQLRVINGALGHLGQEPVAALDSATLEGSIAATKLLRFADQARDEVLARHGWTCALKDVVLSPAVIAGVSPSFRYPGLFQLPGDALRVWSIGGWDEAWWGDRWIVTTVDTDVGALRLIRADVVTQLPVSYVRRASWAALDPHVRQAMAYQLAWRAAYSVTGDQNRADKLQAAVERAFEEAVSVDGTQQGGERVTGWSPAAILRRSVG